MNLAIETQGLGKRYGDMHAVEDLSLRIAEGEIYAFLGLNGAGKTTTIRMLLGMIVALRELELPCPAAVSLVGFDDFDWSAYIDPPMTIVRQPAACVLPRGHPMRHRLQTGERPVLRLQQTRRPLLKTWWFSSLSARGSRWPWRMRRNGCDSWDRSGARNSLLASFPPC